jgi:hypothetical protein
MKILKHIKDISNRSLFINELNIDYFRQFKIPINDQQLEEVKNLLIKIISNKTYSVDRIEPDIKKILGNPSTVFRDELFKNKYSTKKGGQKIRKKNITRKAIKK